MAKAYKRTEEMATDDFVARRIPESVQPYIRLTRLERRFDVWTLVFPSWFGCLLVRAGWQTWLILTLGSIVMLGAACTYNDIIDRDVDAKSKRTEKRPIPSGKVTLKNAWLFFWAQMGLALILFLFLNPFAKLTALGCLPFMFLYPFMKRITWYPHFFAGIILNYGALMAWAQEKSALSVSAFLLYLGGVCWSAAYDAAYGVQDMKDDKKNGVKSAAVRLGSKLKIYLYIVYGLMLVFTLAAGVGRMNEVFFVLYPLVWAVYPWTVSGIKRPDRESAFKNFHNNREIGLLFLLVFIIGII